MKKFFAVFLALWMTLGCVHAPSVDRNAAPPRFAQDEVVVYVRSGCPYCERALELIMDKGVFPDVRNVTENAEFFKELVTLSHSYFSGRQIIVPVIALNGRVLRGYNPHSILELLNGQPISDPDNFAYCE